MSQVLGIDIGGTGIKGAPVDVETGALTAERHRLPTPQPALTADMVNTVAALVTHFKWKGPIGCGYPGVVKNGVIHTAANLHPSLIGVDMGKLIADKTKCPVWIANDADAAGLAEMRFGAGRDARGVVLMLTIGTGIGVAMFVNGVLVPNLELGHMEVGGKEAEHRASERVRVEKDLTWKAWARRFDRVLLEYDKLLWPDLIIIGGGVSKNFDKFIDLLTVRSKVVRAQLMNEAGIVGAAMVAMPTEA